MNWLTKLPGYQRTPYGFEWRLLRMMPHVLLAGTVLPLLMAGCQAEPPEIDAACALPCVKKFDGCKVKRGEGKAYFDPLIDCTKALEACVKACPVK